MEEKANEETDLMPRDTSVLQSFWDSPTLQELARSQGVQPVADVRMLSGTWPGDRDDGFEAAIDELRGVGSGHGAGLELVTEPISQDRETKR